MEDFASVIIGIIVIILLFIIFIPIDYWNEQSTTCVVQDKWIKNNNSDGKYLVKCGKEVYEIDDLFFKGKFNSSDIYSELKVGKKYKITTTGYRIRILSDYKNINKYKEVK